LKLISTSWQQNSATKRSKEACLSALLTVANHFGQRSKGSQNPPHDIRESIDASSQ
jgi:hypothetical protein